MGRLEIVDWDRFQHYKDRWPPWIKNYTELLADHGYLELSGHRRSILHGLWLAYAMSHAQLTDNTATLSRQLNLRVLRRDLEALQDAGFIALQSQQQRTDASAPLAERSNGASPHALARGREETETETEELRPQGSTRSSLQNPQTQTEARPPAREPDFGGLEPLDYTAVLTTAQGERNE